MLFSMTAGANMIFYYNVHILSPCKIIKLIDYCYCNVVIFRYSVALVASARKSREVGKISPVCEYKDRAWERVRNFPSLNLCSALAFRTLHKSCMLPIPNSERWQMQFTNQRLLLVLGRLICHFHITLYIIKELRVLL